MMQAVGFLYDECADVFVAFDDVFAGIKELNQLHPTQEKIAA
jgi:hypothetical protein